MTHALHYAHGITKTRACFAALLPAICCCVLLFVLVIGIITMAPTEGFAPPGRP